MTTIMEAIVTALVVIIICLGITCWVQHSKINSLQAEVITASNQKASCDTSNATFKADAQSNNNEIESIVIDDQKRADTATAAIKSSDAVRQQKNTEASTILSQKVDSDDCKGALQVLHSYVTGGK